MKIDPKRLRLYAVTDRAWTHDAEGLLRQVAAAVDGGAGIVQLREKHMGQADFLAEAERFVALCREKGAVSIINDNVEIAAQTGADGVHVGQEDLEAGRARELLGPDKLIGVSAHSVEEALAAQAAGADYLGVGAAFVTGTKTDAKPISRETIRAITGDAKIQATLRKKLKGRWEKDKALLEKVAGLPEQEASDWAFLAAEVINWEWLAQVLEAAGWAGTTQEAIDIIRAAVIVEEGMKVGVEAEQPEV